jgi:HD-like signal output (HDOD) protein/CheY-like chemotaxis protein
MRRVLFVDDDDILLRALARAVRARNGRWEAITANDGEAALKEMRGRSVDVIVSDVRMPGVDGPTLLQTVRNEWPGAVRILMSGYADEEQVTRALPVAQQFVSKPCSLDDLFNAIDRACTQRDLLRNQRLIDIVGRLDRVPSPPEAYWALSEALVDPTLQFSRVAAVIERDPSAATKLLQLVNSSFFGAPRPTASVEQALARLGVQLVRTLVLSANIFAQAGGPHLLPLAERSYFTARVARRLAPVGHGDEAFAAGLLCDLGRIVVAASLPGTSTQIDGSVRNGARRLDVERRLLGATHAEIGAYLLALWKIPHNIVDAVAHHEEPWRSGPGNRGLLLTTHVAASLVDEEMDLDSDWVEEAGAGPNVDDWRGVAQEERADTSTRTRQRY